ncbi:uncharacterized protein V6R79_008431 [Siganus canaliculatus]
MKVQFLCLLLTVLTVAVLSRKPSIQQRYKKFQNQHIIEQMSANRCDGVMQARNISKVGRNGCKKINTFIRAQINEVKPVCEKDGEPYGEMTKSLKRFKIVVCTLKEEKNKKAKYPNCHYRGKALTKKIIIKCIQGFPVHYDGDIGHCEN